MNERIDALFAVLAALLVLFSAMWDPRVSMVVALIALVSLGVYEAVRQRRVS